MQYSVKMSKKSIVQTAILSLVPLMGFTQILPESVTVERITDIKEESVVVERVYKPKVEAANKIKPSPNFRFPESTKDSLVYQTKAFGVASDFETSLIDADKAELQLDELYKNYIRAGYGNNANLRLDGFYIHPLNVDRAVGVDFRYAATDPNFNQFDNQMSDIKVAGFIQQKLSGASIDGSVGLNYNQSNLYGIPNYLQDDTSEDLDISINHMNIWVHANYEDFTNAIVKNAFIESSYLTDNFNSSEIDFTGQSSIGLSDLSDSFLDSTLGVNADLSVGFNRLSQSELIEDDTNQWGLSVAPQATFVNDYAELNIGPNLVYEGAGEESKIRVFPAVDIKYQTIPQFGLYAKVSGGVNRVNLHSTTKNNPFVMPNLKATNSIEKIKFLIGIKGDWMDRIKYNVQSSYTNIDNLPIYVKANNVDIVKAYAYQNAFQTIYDDGNKIQIKADAKYMLNEDLTIGGSLTFQQFELDNLQEAYEMPSIIAQFDTNYKFWNEKILVEGNFIFNGERKGFRLGATEAENQTVDLDAFFDLNTRATYLFNERLSFFVEGKNLLNVDYERFTDYKVQGIQILGGLMFKF